VIKVVFLDAGETILHPHPSFPELFSRTAASRGIDVSPEQVAPVLYGALRNMDRYVTELGLVNPSMSAERSRTLWVHIYERCLVELGIEDGALAGELFAVFSDVSTYRLFPDALPAIRQLRATGYILGLISNFEGWLEDLLIELEVGHVFDVAVISGLEGVEKPDPKIYKIALEKAGVEPKSAVHVGDSLSLDIQPAAQVGMKTVLLDRAGRHPEVDCPTITSLEELPALVANL
jgi:putative hydrolase of the HAD superfamily